MRQALPVILLFLPIAVVLLLRLRPRQGALSARRTPTRPPATPRLVPIGGCLECGSHVGQGHTGYCLKSKMRGGSGGVVTEADCRRR